MSSLRMSLTLALLLCSMLLYGSVALPLPASTTFITNLTQVATPPTSPLESRCMAQFNESSSGAFPLNTRRVLIAALAGADSHTTTLTYQYYSRRGAPVSLYCGGNLTLPTPILNVYLPTFTIQPEACIASIHGADFDVIVVPGGYESVLALRVDVSFQRILSEFITNQGAAANRSRALVLIQEAAEVLIEPSLVSAFPNGTVLPTLTPAVELAIAAANMTSNLTISPNTTTTVVTMVVGAAVAEGLKVGLTSGDSLDLLIHVSRAALSFVADYWEVNQTTVDCSNDNITMPLTFPPSIFSSIASDASIGQLWSDNVVNGGLFGLLNASYNISDYQIDLSVACRNEQGDNTCSGKKYAVVVAHGSHDLQVVGLLRGLESVGALPEIYCPDTDELSGLIYALPTPPSLFPTLAVTCTHYYNESYIVFDDSIFVVGGPIATHRRLRLDIELIHALDQAPSFALYGTALALLGSIRSWSVTGNALIETPIVPRCIYANVDVVHAGFALTNQTTFVAFNPVTDGVIMYRDHVTKQRQRELGGYPTLNLTMVSFELFVQEVLGAQAWNVGPTSSADHVVGAVLISTVVVLAVGIMVFKLVQRRLKRSRSSAYVSVHRHDDDDDHNLY